MRRLLILLPPSPPSDGWSFTAPGGFRPSCAPATFLTAGETP
ncbi:hypothetical protein FB465_2064 [Kitasatospora atroaurantiaca]|uniref:Uncharacterized protein n=1 Tax=Kitasatospora atroaurantiaca TaxID=285545 RepID=A0A561EN70_9ACTN|nr:hypothetical protein FB465_2064 [Kitasatospora atroaurantiaca]